MAAKVAMMIGTSDQAQTSNGLTRTFNPKSGEFGGGGAVERMTRLELATSTLGRSRSTN